ncbi:8-oxo-dGDP phosphatase NUDT18 [Alosa sapidissima]|uniref:8-oxo-dGDP phosphatase NUDT18 n=1 Tax=Alosa sapidissima TaxID=34773 RepID=UPI001C09B378|nr:8-oxo-dGDP phosphatase NUDT18 [Alosa sapidissima]XP_041955785.1 8-oxo-dGDP phosphatase NUDT18 [Alosa sapidissima]XP_041955786.1 8-oxo-dGDP phosphatase NUDT18 [Alosa sapidissima]
MVKLNMGSIDFNLEQNVERILNGEGMEVTGIDSAPEQIKPVTLRKTVCYIVSAVILNSKKEVLMVQEAKQECYGRWYLPAGRMEEGESIEEAMKREVREEAGLECQPISLIQVQEQGPQWVRFAFLAEVTGGTLKTEAQADAESLQACWWDRKSPLPLRGRDILSLIETGLRYQEKPWFAPVLPLDLPCPVVCQRLVLAFAAGIYVWLLVSKGPQGSNAVSGRSVSTEEEERSRRRRSTEMMDMVDAHLPVALSTKTHTVTWAAHRLVQECMPSCYYDLDVNTHGLLGVQHGGRVPGKTDGLCFNTLVSLTLERRTGASGAPPTELGGKPADPPPVETNQYHWHKVDSPVLRDNILRRIRQGSTLPVLSLY